MAAVSLSLVIILCSHAQNRNQVSERLFCGLCGEQNGIAAVFCGKCGEKLEKHALVSRLQLKLAHAEALSEPVTMMPDEIKVLAYAEAEKRIAVMMRKPILVKPSRPQSELDRILGVVVPAAIGVGALYFFSLAGPALFK